MRKFILRHRHKIKEIGLGVLIYEAQNLVYDFVFYPFALLYWGFFWGGVIAVGVSLIINIVIFAAYEYMAVDWLGAHALRELDEKQHKSDVEKMITWIGKKKESLWEKLLSPIVFVALTLPIDPVIVAIHHKKHHFRKHISRRDWGLLVAATLAANAWWLIKVEVVIEGVKFIGERFF